MFDPAEYISEAVKLSNIWSVQDKFTIQCKGDWELFESHFPGLRYKYTKLLKAVHCARQEWGEAKHHHC
jgi:hypothetical protein